MTLVDVLRSLRTGAYRLASPADGAIRALRGLPRLPPLWLRRHAGPPSAFLSAANDTSGWLARLDLLRPTSRVLDVGCGCGSMVPAMAQALGPAGSYVGFDVHEPSIDWCRRAFRHDRRFRFEVAEIRTPYSTHGRSLAASAYRFPVADGAVDLLLAKSVFTHLLAAEVTHYLDEIRRVLSPNGRAFVTYFLFADLDASVPAFPFPRTPREPVRWRVDRRPHAAVAYWKDDAIRRIAEAGLRVETFVPGFWPGNALLPAGQDQLVLSVAPDR